MRRPRRAPLVLPAAAAALGAVLSLVAVYRPVPALVLLVGLGGALGAGPGIAVAGVAGGMVAGARLRDDSRAGPALGRPATVVLVLATPWLRDGDSWVARGRALRFRQANRVEIWHQSLVVTVASVERPAEGARLRATGHLRRRPAPGNGGLVRPGPFRLAVPHRALIQAWEAGGWRVELLRLRASIAGRLQRAGEGGALARSLALGDTSELPDRWLRGLRRCGLGHLVAVSGLHVGLVAVAAWWLSSAWGRTGRAVVTAGAIAGYALVAGGRPSVERAAVAGLLAVGATSLGRPPSAVNGLSAAVLGLSVADPRLWLQGAFRMSVGATVGLLALCRHLERRLGGLPALLRRTLAAAVSAQLGTIAFVVSEHGYLPLAAGPLHLLALPWAFGVLVLTGLYLIAGWLGPAGGLETALGGALGLAARPLEGLSRLPAGHWWGVVSSAPMVTLVVFSVVFGLVATRVRAGVAATCALAVLGAGGAAGVEPTLGVVVLDVGQGDAILLRDGREGILVDGGGWTRGDLGGRVLVPALGRLGIDRLGAIVLTHPDRDHCQGLIDLASYLRVAELWVGPGWQGDRCVARLLALAGVSPRPLWRGEVRRWRRWRVEALGPPAGKRRGRNERSLVLRAHAGGRTVLLTGDIGQETEHALLTGAGRERLAADILKVAHHGSRGSSSSAFLRASSARLAVVSVGAGNPYGHPAPELWGRLERAGVPRLRTDRDGQVRITIVPGRPLRVELPAFGAGSQPW